MEKEEYSILVTKWFKSDWGNQEGLNALEDILESRLTSDQIADLCEVLWRIPILCAVKLIAHQDFEDRHFNIIMGAGDSQESIMLFSSNVYRTKEQIMAGLHDASAKVRNAAYNHPCCTDAMRVEYDLIKGCVHDR